MDGVKVLDFGLAKALEPAGAPHDIGNSPTLTSPAMTRLGVILGTPAYMSPEQARGKVADKRADIWAFGVVLYEMLTGQRAFRGDGVSETLASVLKDTPSLDALPAATPLRLRRLLERCLERDPTTRLRDVGEARIEIARIHAGWPDMTAVSAPAPTATPRALVSRMLSWILAAAFGAALVLTLLVWSPWQSAPVLAPRNLLTNIGADASLATGLGASAILSPDGTTLAFVARQADQTRLFVRKLAELRAVALPGTEGAGNPFFKPDGQWLAFFADGQLRKISVNGGAVVKVCNAAANYGGTWADDDTIFFATGVALMSVSAAGGTAAVFGAATDGSGTRRWPQALPKGMGVLYTERSSGSASYDSANVVVAPLTGGRPTVVLPGGYYGRYVPSGLGSPKRAERAGGHMVYMQQGILFAVPFDLDRLEPVGQAVSALTGVSTNLIQGSAQLAFSSEGTLTYVPGELETATNPIDWMTSDGKTSVLRATKAAWTNPRFSPDGTKLALEISDGKQRDIWVYEWTRDELTQVTFDPGDDRTPVWAPGGRHLVFSSDRAKPGIFNMYLVNDDGAGAVTRLLESSESQVAYSWYPPFLAFQADRAITGWDLMVLTMEGDATRGWMPGKQPTIILASPGREIAPMFSPDGRWIAYVSAANGPPRVQVRPFRGAGGPWTISLGVVPRWSATALLFLNSIERKVMAVPYTVVGGAFRPGTPQVWSPTSYIRSAGLDSNAYDLHPDGNRLAVAAAHDQTGVLQDKVVFIFNFSNYLREIAPGKQ